MTDLYPDSPMRCLRCNARERFADVGDTGCTAWPSDLHNWQPDTGPVGSRDYYGMDESEYPADTPLFCIDCGAPAFYIDDGPDHGYYHAVPVAPDTCFSSAMRDDVPDPAHPRYSAWLDGWTWDDQRRTVKYDPDRPRRLAFLAVRLFPLDYTSALGFDHEADVWSLDLPEGTLEDALDVLAGPDDLAVHILETPDHPDEVTP